MTAKKKAKRVSRIYVVEFRIEVESPNEGDDTPFIVEQDIRQFLVDEMSKRKFKRVEFGFIDDVGAMEDEEVSR
jgi:hypothetical protein